MRKVIIDYKKLNKEVATLLIDSYPHGYGDDDIIIFEKAKWGPNRGCRDKDRGYRLFGESVKVCRISSLISMIL